MVDSGDLHDGSLRDAFLLCYGTKLTLRIGTGLSDGFPPGGVDAHEVRDLHFLLAAELDHA